LYILKKTASNLAILFFGLALILLCDVAGCVRGIGESARSVHILFPLRAQCERALGVEECFHEGQCVQIRDANQHPDSLRNVGHRLLAALVPAQRPTAG